jgi:hypothetical protein
MTLVVDRMREVLQENEQLHATIADLRMRQEHTENRLALLENAGSGVVETAAVPRHAPDYNSELEEFLAQTTTFLRGDDLASLVINEQRCHNSPKISPLCQLELTPAMATCVHPRVCGRKPWFLISLNEPRTLAEVETPIVVYLSPAMRYLLGYDTVRCSFTHTL